MAPLTKNKNKHMIQIQITQINNGWLVATPPSKTNQLPEMIFCENYNAVILALKRVWPKENIQISLGDK